MKTLMVLPIILTIATGGIAQQTPNAKIASGAALHAPARAQEQAHGDMANIISSATNNSVFIYNTKHYPCDEVPEGQSYLAEGSGFVVAIRSSTAHSPKKWMFLVTAKHVISGFTEIYIRVNDDTRSGFICTKIELQEGRNLFIAKEGVDLAAIALQPIEGYEPRAVTSDMLMDEKKMREEGVGVGTEIITVGYLYGYGGQKANYPMAKFGHISMLSNESWLRNQYSPLVQQAYVLDLTTSPGLSGSPVYTYGIEIRTEPARFRKVPTYVIGVAKATLITSSRGSETVSKDLTLVEPASNLRAMMRAIAEAIKKSGNDVETIN